MENSPLHTPFSDCIHNLKIKQKGKYPEKRENVHGKGGNIHGKERKWGAHHDERNF